MGGGACSDQRAICSWVLAAVDPPCSGPCLVSYLSNAKLCRLAAPPECCDRRPHLEALFGDLQDASPFEEVLLLLAGL